MTKRWKIEDNGKNEEWEGEDEKMKKVFKKRREKSIIKK